MTNAMGVSTPLSVGIVSFDNYRIQISTTKETLRGENILICSSVEKSCAPYQGNDFSNMKPEGAIEDVATGGNIYTYYYNDIHRHKMQAETSLAFIFPGNEVKVDDVEFNGQRDFIIQSEKVKDVFTYCTSSEGVHVLSHSGSVHLYYSLGYEVEVSCPDEAYK